MLRFTWSKPMNDQRTQEWYRKRLGRVTGSELHRLRSPRSRQTYAQQIRGEFDLLKRIENGEEIDLVGAFSNNATSWGINTEPRARAMWEFRHDQNVTLTDFVIHPRFDFVGCSPDWLVPKQRGGAEAKCPYNSGVHLSTVISDRVPDEHLPQVHGLIWIKDLDWVDFVSFDPRVDSARRYFERRVYRDEKYIDRLEDEVIEFWDYVLSGDDTQPDITAGGIPALF